MTARRGLILALALFALVVCIGLLSQAGVLAPIDEFGIRAVGFLRRLPGAGLVSTLSVWLHWLGGSGGRLLIAMTLGMFLARAGRSDEMAWLLLAVTGVMLLNPLIKLAFALPRPIVFFPTEIFETSYGFPSGHAAGAMTLYGAIALLTRLRLVQLFCLGMILATGASRVWLGVHWPSDVAGGWLEGAAWLLAILPLRHPAMPPPSASGGSVAGAGASPDRA
ncbi:MAG: phosphatase PAP2 family protein [Sphingomonadales bacterium]|nr:phosphatase PAP2 family protein [Sphingomonadales bacterium]